MSLAVLTSRALTGMEAPSFTNVLCQLQAIGWLTIHYQAGKKCRVVENYALAISKGPATSEESPVMPHSMADEIDVPDAQLGFADEFDYEELDSVSLSDVELDKLLAADIATRH
jgi:hypothetical protein